MNGKKKETLKKAAKECVQRHTMLVYNQLPNYWQYSDVYPDMVNGCKRWWEMYSDNTFLIRNNQSALSSFYQPHATRTCCAEIMVEEKR